MSRSYFANSCTPIRIRPSDSRIRSNFSFLPAIFIEITLVPDRSRHTIYLESIGCHKSSRTELSFAWSRFFTVHHFPHCERPKELVTWWLRNETQSPFHRRRPLFVKLSSLERPLTFLRFLSQHRAFVPIYLAITAVNFTVADPIIIIALKLSFVV